MAGDDILSLFNLEDLEMNRGGEAKRPLMALKYDVGNWYEFFKKIRTNVK